MPVNLRTYTIIILFGCVIILSYLFSLLSRKTKIPSVLLLIATGIGVNYVLKLYGYPNINVQKLVKIFGAVGIIMIILEAAMDLKINAGKINLIRNSFFAATFIFILSVFGISMLISYSMNQSLHLSMIYAIPLSIISSAIVIPSTEHLPKAKKEFIIYESSFSDIIGILFFNYMIMDNILSFRTIAIFGGNILMSVAISILSSFIMLYILTKTTMSTRFFLIFAVLGIIYSLGELIHIPSLLIVLIFGLVLNNSELILRGKIVSIITPRDMDNILHLMRSITSETSFLLRTFFFILFGYSMDITILTYPNVIITGSFIVLILFFSRFLYLRFILRANLLPELFLMPRGLVTILLFYSIPINKTMVNFNAGILFFVVVISSLTMMVGLIFFHKNEVDIL